MNDEQIFELAEKIGFQDDFGRWNFTSENLLDFVFMVQKAEREACALICENMERNGAWITKSEAADAIRARGLVEPKASSHPEQKMRIEGSGTLTTKPYPDRYESEQEFRQALAQDALRKLAEIDHELGLYEDGPAVKTYCGGKPNYCTPVDAVNMSQDRVDETAKREHEPECVAVIGNWGKVEWKEGVFPQLGDKLYTAPPKREWVGLTKEEAKEISMANRPYVIDMIAALEAKLKEKNA